MWTSRIDARLFDLNPTSHDIFLDVNPHDLYPKWEGRFIEREAAYADGLLHLLLELCEKRVAYLYHISLWGCLKGVQIYIYMVLSSLHIFIGLIDWAHFWKMAWSVASVMPSIVLSKKWTMLLELVFLLKSLIKFNLGLLSMRLAFWVKKINI